MTKQTKRKGFTAVEMLVVIAIIAGLTAVVIPVVGNQTVKSKAAVNAANLRAVEATISLKMADSPEDFEAFFDKGEVLQKVSDGPLGKVYNFFFGDGDAEASRVKYDFLADNGKNQLQIPGSGLVISGLTLSKGLEAPRRDGGAGLTIGDGQGMRVCITEAGPLAFYGDYTKEDFADVAEDGYYDGMVTGTGGNENNGWLPDWIENPVEQATCKSGLLENKHQTGPGCVCPYCGAEAHIDADKTTSWGMTEYLTSTSRHACRCGKVFNGDHVYEGSDHACKYNDCDKVTPCVDLDPEDDGFLGLGGDKADHKCYLCGGDNNHAWCTTDNKGGGTRGNQPDHKCDTCGYVMSTCTIKEISYTQHQCTTCEVKSSHNFQNGVCECGAEQKSCKFDGCDRTDVQDDYYCAGHQEKSCTAKVMGKNWLGQSKVETCSGKYRDTIADCSNVGNHAKCKICGDSNIKDDGYCSSHQEKTCKEPVLKSGGGTKSCGTEYRDTCENAANHHTTHTYVDDPNNATQHKCACNAAEKHNYVNGTCSVCNKTMPTCKFNPCEETNVQSNGYCAGHQEKSCTAKVMGRRGVETCSGKYRGTIEDCSNVGKHAKCDICGDYNVQNDGYCSSHQEKTCTENVLRSGGGTQRCNTKYRDTCKNAANHHTTHTYKQVATDAVKHQCACGATENHNYVNGSCTVCGRSSHSAPNDCVDNNKDHKCDTCSKTLSDCKDDNKDHMCDTCTKAMGNCSDSANDKDHVCDYGCGKTLNNCSDSTTDKDHKCDTCGKTLNNCSDSTTDKDHKCDTCGETLSDCKDSNPKDQKCDTCGASMGGGCVTPDTLVTLADGSLKRIDEVTTSDYLLVWDFYQGKSASVPAAIIFDHGYGYNTVISLHFSDGTIVKVVNLHQFYDADLNSLVTIDANSVQQYIGHSFAKQGGKTVKLVGYTISQEYVEAFGIISAVHYNIYVEGMLSADFMPEDYDLFNYFAFGTDMKFDQAQMQSDIEQYGLYTYEEFADYLTYEQFIGFNVPYMKVAVGKGNYTYEGILNLINQYLGQ